MAVFLIISQKVSLIFEITQNVTILLQTNKNEEI